MKINRQNNQLRGVKTGSPSRLGQCRPPAHMFAVLIGLLLSLCSPSPAQHATDIATRADQVETIVAHRGDSANSPESTLSAIEQAIVAGATVVEVDVRMSRDGTLFILHDETLERTTNGEGRADEKTVHALQQLDAGSWFHPRFAGQRIPTLQQVLTTCRGRCDVLLDLKQEGDEYAQQVARVVRLAGDPWQTIVGVRSVSQARQFRQLLPESQQLGLVPTTDTIAAFIAAGVETIRLWPRWLADGDTRWVDEIRKANRRLHLNGTRGELAETEALLQFAPDSLSSDDPGRLIASLESLGQPVEPLNGTRRLRWREADLSQRLMNGAHRFVERKRDEAAALRHSRWSASRTESERAAFFAERRELLRTMIGAVDPRVSPALETFSQIPESAVLVQTGDYQVQQVRWQVIEGLATEGLLVTPTRVPRARVVIIPDANQQPEELLGIRRAVTEGKAVTSIQPWVRWLAANDFQIILLSMLDRDPLPTNDEQLRRSGQTPREWIYRQAFHMGRHPLGYDVQRTLAAVDWFEAQNATRQQREPAPLGLIGYGEGGMVALHAAAMDPRIKSTLVSGYFGPRDDAWREPIDRNLWGRLLEFGDAELAALISGHPTPRHLTVEYSPTPRFHDSKGTLPNPSLAQIRAEVDRVSLSGVSRRPRLITGQDNAQIGPGSPVALQAFAEDLSAPLERQVAASAEVVWLDSRAEFTHAARQARLLSALEQTVQKRIRQADQQRDERFLYRVMPALADRRWTTQREYAEQFSLPSFVAASQSYREEFRTEAMGAFDEPLVSPNARSRRLFETPAYTAYDVVVDVYPELIAWGVLLLPKGLDAGEKRPVVVCQHGRNGVPLDTVNRGIAAYNDFAAKLAERGFVTFAPHNLYRGEDRYRWLDRKANGIKATLFSLIIAQHEQWLNWLKSLSCVDPDRIAFYGLSYGGETAMRVPTVLEGYCLSICSGDFNQWTRKVAATDQPFSFMRTIEWEMPYWNLGATYDYAEMAYLMIPRPFMVERGHHDRVGRDQWVAHEYAKVRWLYAQFGLADRTEIEFFQGGHSINGKASFDFLHRHLDWPKP